MRGREILVHRGSDPPHLLRRGRIGSQHTTLIGKRYYEFTYTEKTEPPHHPYGGDVFADNEGITWCCADNPEAERALRAALALS